jgi:hypothetical protein
MEGESSATCGSHLIYNQTSHAPSAGESPPSTCSFTTCLLELYQECMDNGGWASVLYEVCGRIEKLSLICKKPLAAPVTTPPYHANLDIKWLARGGKHAIEGGGRPGQRGGISALDPAPSSHLLPQYKR